MEGAEGSEPEVEGADAAVPQGTWEVDREIGGVVEAEAVGMEEAGGVEEQGRAAHGGRRVGLGGGL